MKGRGFVRTPEAAEAIGTVFKAIHDGDADPKLMEELIAARFGGWLQLCAARPDRTQPLGEAGPRPGLDLLVAESGLASSRFEVLEPGVGFLDQQQLLRFALLLILAMPLPASAQQQSQTSIEKLLSDPKVARDLGGD